MKILITGCAGFIGVNFTKYWLENHAEDIIVGVDCLTYAANASKLKNLQENSRFIFYKTDICDREAIYRIFQTEKPDILVNFAAESHVDAGKLIKLGWQPKISFNKGLYDTVAWYKNNVQ